MIAENGGYPSTQNGKTLIIFANKKLCLSYKNTVFVKNIRKWFIRGLARCVGLYRSKNILFGVLPTHYSTLSIFSMTKKLLQPPGLDVLYTFSIFEGYVVHGDEDLGVAIVDSFKRGVFALLRLFVFKRP